MKNAVKKSFLAIPSQKLHTGPLCAGDQRRAHLVSIWWSKICVKRLYFRTFFFVKIDLHSSEIEINEKKYLFWKKKEKIEVEKLLNYSWLRDLRNSWVAPVER